MPLSIPVLSLGMVALGLDAYVVAGLLPGIAARFGVSVAEAGRAVAVFTLFYALSAPVLATMLAGRPARLVLGVALAVFTAANAGSALAPGFGWLLASRALAGTGAGLYAPLAAAAAAGLVAQERRGRALGAILGGMSVGTVVGVPAGLAVARHLGWQGALWMVTGVGGIALAGVLAFLPAASPAAPPSLRERLALLRDARVVRIVAQTFLLGTASLGLYTYAAALLEEAGLAREAGSFLALWGAGGILGSVAIGRVIDRVGRTSALFGGIGGLLLAVFGLLPAALGHPGLAAALFVLWGLLGWASQAPQQHRLLAAHPGHGAAAVALNSSANYLGSAAGALLGGLLLDGGAAPRHLPLAAAAAVALALGLSAVRFRRPARPPGADAPRPAG
ncbi:MFS transporter [Methylobacterium sp. JK268]